METNKELKTLQKKILRTKKDLREWESVFAKKHGRPPTISDISQRPNIEKFYKKYNALKKQLKQETEQCHASPPRSNQTIQQSPPRSVTNRRNSSSVEFVRSPSHPLSRRRPSIFDSSSSSSQQTVRRLSEFEEMKSALVSVSSQSSSQQQKQLTEDEAFWLDVPDSHSQPTTSFQFSSSQQQQSTRRTRQLILGGASSQPIVPTKKNLKQLKLFGMTQNPFQRAIHSPQLSPTEVPSPRLTISQPITLQNNDKKKKKKEEEEEEEEEDEENIEIIYHKVDPFKDYDPSLFQWHDPTFSIGPGFFSQVCKATPILNDPIRLQKVLYKLEKGTLGEVVEENKLMEEDVSEDLRAFITANSQLDTLESALTTIDENLFNKSEYTYKKKPLQKRQTKLYKMKFVETRI